MVSEKNQYYPLFDYLRLALACVVMLVHDSVISWAPAGKLAVDVFFAMSGWLIGTILLTTNVKGLPRFFFNRALRIWVPYYFALLLVIVASFAKDSIGPEWFEFVFYKLTWVYNKFGTIQLSSSSQLMPLQGSANHFWSVNAEEQFYLLAPIVLVLFSSIGRRMILWLLIVCICLVSKSYAPIALGVLAAIVNQRFPDFQLKRSVQSLVFIILLISLVGIIYTVGNEDVYKFFPPFFAISLILLVAKKGQQRHLGRVLGGLSYPLYLNHWVGVFLFNFIYKKLGLELDATRVVLSSIFSLFFSYILYTFIDSTVLNLRGKLFTHFRGIVITRTAYAFTAFGALIGTALHPSVEAYIVFSIFLFALVIMLMSSFTKFNKA